MADNIYGNGTNSTVGANTITHFYDRAGINAANRVNVYGQFVDRRSMPTKMGKTFKVSRFEHMYDRKMTDPEFAKKGYMSSRSVDELTSSLTNAALSEGMGAGNKRTLTKVTYQTTFARYGEMIDYTDEVEIFSEDYIQTKYREELGELANSRQEDLLQRDMLGTTTVLYSGDAGSMSDIGATAGIDYTVSYDLIRKASRVLTRNRAKKNTSIVEGSTKIGTTPVAKAFYAIIGSEVKADLEKLTRGVDFSTEYVYVPVHKYANGTAVAEGEVGAMHETRFIEAESAAYYAGVGATVTSETEDLSYDESTNKLNVFPILFPTEGSFATVGLKGHDKIKFNAQSPEKVELTNPYGTTGFFSYSFFYAGLILKEEALLKVLVAASK
jgi:N4-gp56 family major capsid protein